MSRSLNGTSIDEMSCQTQIEIEFKKFSKEKRFRIWRALFSRETQQQPPSCVASHVELSDNVLHGISEWELNGHEIKHFFQNVLLLWNNPDEKCVTLFDIDGLRVLTWSPSKQAVATSTTEIVDGEIQTSNEQT